MDIDAFREAHADEWSRLADLVSRRHLTADESDELLDLYQRTATHLSLLRSNAPDQTMMSYLSGLLVRARLRFATRRRLDARAVGHFFTDVLPGTLYDLRRWWLGVLVASVVGGFAVGIYALNHPEVYSQVLTESQINQLVNYDFANYYYESSNSDFALRVWTNNAWVSAQCIIFGLVGFPVVQLLWDNMLNASIIGALMTSRGKEDVFWGLILPHGILELTAIFVAGGMGLRLFWSWIAPGRRTRLQSFTRAGRQAMVVVFGLIMVLGVSGLLEGFVTPSGLPPVVKVGVGIVAEIFFFIYVFVLGRAAARRGEVGDQDRREIGEEAPISA